MAELISLQNQDIAIVQQVDTTIATGIDQIGDWVVSYGDAYEERTEAIKDQTVAIRENTQAVEQLASKFESTMEATKPQNDAAKSLPE